MYYYILSKIKTMTFKKILLFLTLSLLSLFQINQTSWANLEDLENTLTEYGIAYQDHVYISNNVTIDLSSLETSLKENFSDIPLEYEWDIYGQSSQNWPKLDTKFETTGEKAIQLSIYSKTWEVKSLIRKIDISVFIYDKSIPLIVSSQVSENLVEDFIRSWQDLWVYVKQIGRYDEDTIPGQKIIEELEEYIISFPENSNYSMIWWEKEFLFSTLSQIHTSWENIDKINFVLVSSYNTTILRNYISNSISGKNFIDTAFIIDESLKFQVLKNPKNIQDLEQEVKENSYSYTPISEQKSIQSYFFASRFVNMLSNMWIPTSDIYIILLLPLFLTAVGFAKHMIGIGSLWNTIPVFITILFIKMWIIFTLGLLGFLLIFNIIISRFISKYTLLYTPKVACITILNLLWFMWFYQLIWYFTVIQIPLDNVLYVAIFFLLAEKMISIITTKEFREYKRSIYGTIIISLLCYMMYDFDTLRIFIMAYPEILLAFVPLNFFLGRFTWLRITEYLRFKEIVKSIEE